MQVVICSGASGSGKSTWAEARAKEQDGVLIVSADSYFYEDGWYVFDPSKLSLAHGMCLWSFARALLLHEQGRKEAPEVVIVDNTNTTVAEVAPYYALAEAYGADVVIRRFIGAHVNQHGTPPIVVERQRLRAQQLILDAPPWWQFENHHG